MSTKRVKKELSWNRNLTENFLQEARLLVESLKAFRKRWSGIASKYNDPVGDDAEVITDMEADLNDAMDRFSQSE